MATAALGIGGVAYSYFGRALPPDAQASFVGRSSCIECHRDQAQTFTGSHHDLAMDLATDDTVLGDFNNAQIEHDGMTSRMFRDGKVTGRHDKRADDLRIVEEALNAFWKDTKLGEIPTSCLTAIEADIQRLERGG